MSIIDASSGYHNHKLDTQSSYLTTFSCPFQRKMDEIFNDIPNVFGIPDDILVIGYNKDGADHDEAVYSVLEQSQYVNLKLNKDKCHFRCTSILFLGEVVSRKGIKPDPQKVRVLTNMAA